MWPFNAKMAQFIRDNWSRFQGKRILELGAGTGILAIFLKKLGLEVVTTDYDDVQIEENIHHNCELNDLQPIQHVRHSWGTTFPSEFLNSFDLVIANDIFLYTKEYPNLVNTMQQLVRDKSIHCIIGWQRRIEDSMLFFLK